MKDLLRFLPAALCCVACHRDSGARNTNQTADIGQVGSADTVLIDRTTSTPIIYPIGELLFSSSGPAAAPFGDIQDVALGEHGRVYVLDRVNKRVVVMAPTGGVEFVIGRSGKGPGEFISPVGLAARDSQLVVLDDKLRRLSFLNHPSRWTTYELPSGYPTPQVELVGQDRFVVRLTIPVSGDFFMREFRFIEINARTRKSSIIRRVPEPYQKVYNRREPRARWSVNPFATSYEWAVDPRNHFLYVVEGGGYVISKYMLDSNRRIVMKRVAGVTPLPLHASEARNWFTAAAESVSLSRRPLEPQVYQQIKFPSQKHPLEDVVVDSSNRLWVKLRNGSFRDTHATYDVYTSRGQYLAQVKLPFAVSAIGDSILYRVRRDSDDVEYLEAYKYNALAEEPTS